MNTRVRTGPALVKGGVGHEPPFGVASCSMGGECESLTTRSSNTSESMWSSTGLIGKVTGAGSSRDRSRIVVGPECSGLRSWAVGGGEKDLILIETPNRSFYFL